jgi:hypothetical protein
MASVSAATLSPQQRVSLDTLADDLRRIFAARLQSVVAYGLSQSGAHDGLIRTLALLDDLTFDDLHRCVPLTSAWHRRGLAVPLLLTREEFFRSLDVFPLEYGDIIATHTLIAGPDPFAGARIEEADRRRGCEQQAKSHLIHLREGFLEAEGHARDIMWLIVKSVPSFRSLLTNLVQLEDPALTHPSDEELAAAASRTIGLPTATVTEILAAPIAASTIADPTALLSRYIDASERVWRCVDGWRS